MVRTLLSPRWLALHTAVIAALIACGLLGWWQYASYREGRRPAPVATGSTPVPITTVLSAGAAFPATAAQRRVVAAGRYDPSSQLLVPDRELHGKRGFLVVTPLRTADGVLPVHRGWVDSRTARGTAVPSGAVTVTGVLTPSETTGNARVDPNLPVEGELPFIATAELMSRLPYPPRELYEGYLLLEQQTPPSAASPQPVPAEAPVSKVSPWRNLSYAAQWWVFGLAAVGFWFALARRALTETADLSGDTPEAAVSPGVERTH